MKASASARPVRLRDRHPAGDLRVLACLEERRRIVARHGRRTSSSTVKVVSGPDLGAWVMGEIIASATPRPGHPGGTLERYVDAPLGSILAGPSRRPATTMQRGDRDGVWSDGPHVPRRAEVWNVITPQSRTATRPLLAVLGAFVLLSGLLPMARISTADAAGPNVDLTALDVAYTQNFDTLPSSGSATWTNDSRSPAGSTPGQAPARPSSPNNGSSNAGTCTATERAPRLIAPSARSAPATPPSATSSGASAVKQHRLDDHVAGRLLHRRAVAQQRGGRTDGHILVPRRIPTVTGSLAEFQSAGRLSPSSTSRAPSPAGPPAPSTATWPRTAARSHDHRPQHPQRD